MSHLRVVVIVAVVLSVFGACRSEPEPVQPLLAPSRVADITGIWRSPQQSTLELRSNGTYVLVTPVSNALAGEFSLSQDRITLFDDKECGTAQGTYRIQASPEQRLVFTEPDDACKLRRDQLSADPFVYG